MAFRDYSYLGGGPGYGGPGSLCRFGLAGGGTYPENLLMPGNPGLLKRKNVSLVWLLYFTNVVNL